MYISIFFLNFLADMGCIKHAPTGGLHPCVFCSNGFQRMEGAKFGETSPGGMMLIYMIYNPTQEIVVFLCISMSYGHINISMDFLHDKP